MEICQPFFHIGRGYRQGDPVSPFLFVLCTEILGNTIRNKKGIKGIVINNKEHKLSQYADDTVFILDGISKKKVREKSRECHNHKPQPFPDTKRKRKPTNPKSTYRTNVRKSLRLALSSPSEVTAMLKGLKNTKTK